MWQFLRENPYLVGALTGSLATFIVGQAWAYLRREKRWLGYSIETRNVVEANSPQLQVLFNGTPVRRVDSHTIIARNIGNQPLKHIPIRVLAGTGAQILAHEAEPPEGASQNAVTSGGELEISFDLLNPGEAARVGLTVGDSKDGQVRVIARGEHLVVKEIDTRSPTEALIAELGGAALSARLLKGVMRF